LGNYTINNHTSTFRWTLVDFDGQQFTGYWVNSEGQHPWCGWRDGQSKPDGCP
jgi:hypothetical protein